MDSVIYTRARLGRDISIPLTIRSKEDYSILKDSSLDTILTNDVKDNITVDVIDMEKGVFAPVLASGLFPESITFDLYFRQRNLDNWETNDLKGWNEPFLLAAPKDIDAGGDLYAFAGFSENDIHYQKSKIKQSFIRIMFYDGKNPLTQKLLCYSTVFLDSNVMFRKYINEERNGITFTVRDRNYKYASSEGFYAYLFPDSQQSEKMGETIYMKIEFNHAGYGKTIPMMIPPVNKVIPAGFSSDGRLDIENYWNNLYIPIVVKRNGGTGTYMLPDDRILTSDDGSEVRFVLVEPRINNGDSQG